MLTGSHPLQFIGLKFKTSVTFVFRQDLVYNSGTGDKSHHLHPHHEHILHNRRSTVHSHKHSTAFLCCLHSHVTNAIFEHGTHVKSISVPMFNNMFGMRLVGQQHHPKWYKRILRFNFVLIPDSATLCQKPWIFQQIMKFLQIMKFFVRGFKPMRAVDGILWLSFPWPKGYGIHWVFF